MKQVMRKDVQPGQTFYFHDFEDHKNHPCLAIMTSKWVRKMKSEEFYLFHVNVSTGVLTWSFEDSTVFIEE